MSAKTDSAEDVRGFASRVRSLVDEFGVRGLARMVEVSDSTVRKWLSGGDIRGVQLAAISAAAGISAEWLLLGTGDMRPKERNSEVRLDSHHLSVVVETVEQSLQELGLQLQPDKKADLVVALYELTQEVGKAPEKSTVIRLIRSAA